MAKGRAPRGNREGRSGAAGVRGGAAGHRGLDAAELRLRDRLVEQTGDGLIVRRLDGTRWRIAAGGKLEKEEMP